MNTMYELRDYYDFLGTPDPREGTLMEAQQRELKHGYVASVSFIDAQVGRLLKELKTLGLDKNTIVVLWSDHGWKLGEHGSWCKQTNYEIDARVPLIIHDPIRGKNQRASDALVELVDLYPTLCDLAGIPAAAHTEGVSLRPIIEDTSESVKEAAFSQFARRDGKRELMGYSMKTAEFRYIEWLNRKTKKPIARELYDHRTDPEETQNVADEKANAALIKKLSAQLWDSLPAPPDFQLQKNAAAKKADRPALVFDNQLKEKVTVFWIPENGPRKKVGEILPSKSLRQNTAMGHRFLVEGAESDFKKVVTASKMNETITLSKKKQRAKGNMPNIVVIMGDDWSWPHAGILGDPVVKTPTFDRIAREGVLFENAYVSAPSCTPSRFAIVSGQYHWRLESGANLGGSLAANVPVYPDLFADIGYRTGFCRKGASPSKHKFRGNDPFGARFKNFSEFFTAQDKKMPFCFWYGAGEPHRAYDWQASLKSDLDLKAIQVPPYLPDNETTRTDLGDYYLKVEQLDRFAGEIVETLESSGELENTIVVMAGDNGMPFPRAKATLYDSGTRVPLAIRWGKNVKGGRTISDFVSLTDLAPTFLEAGGLDIPKTMTGQSLMSVLAGETTSFRKSVLTGMEQHVYPNSSRAIRTADFLYVRNFAPAAWPTGKTKGEPLHFDFKKTPWPTVPGAFSYNVDPGPTKQWMRENATTGEHAELHRLAFGQRANEELYDLKSDPDQLNNVADDKAFRDTRNQLLNQLTAELRAGGDPRFALPHHASFDVRGWTVHLSDKLWQTEPVFTSTMLDLLAVQLERVVKVVSKKALGRLREVPIWINPVYEGVRPTAEYHGGVGWLKKNGRNPAMGKAIEITNVMKFALEDRRMPYLLLHELSHAYHDRILGFDQKEITTAFKKAAASGSYDNVKRFTGNKIITDKAYAMSNHKEYFAELTEAYFGKNDFFPFTNAELKVHDPAGFAAIEKAWGVSKK